MAIVPTVSDLRAEDSAVTLPRYAQLIYYTECSFYGVRRDTTPARCREIWVKVERDLIRKYLAEAQEELEQVIGYPLAPTWITDEQHPWKYPLLAEWGYVIEAGVRGKTTISADEAVSHLTDPAVIGPVATTVTDEDEIKVYYPASLVEDEIEIHPSDIDIVGGFVTIYVPRCRMVHPDEVDNARTGIDYTDLTNFLTVVDVARVYNDPSTQGELVYPHGTTNCSCGEETNDACIYVRNSRIGALDLMRATYSGGAWTPTSRSCACTPTNVRVNYRAGMNPLTRQAEDAIIRLAHSKMPQEPCACDPVVNIWARDRNIPEVFSRERLNCPFGLADGAWMAWTFAQRMKLMRGGGL